MSFCTAALCLLLLLGCFARCYPLRTPWPTRGLNTKTSVREPIRHCGMTAVGLPVYFDQPVLSFGRIRNVDMLLAPRRSFLGKTSRMPVLPNSWTDLTVSAVTDGIVSYFAESLKQMQKVVAAPPSQLFKSMQRVPRNDTNGANKDPRDRDRPEAGDSPSKTHGANVHSTFGVIAVDNFTRYVRSEAPLPASLASLGPVSVAFLQAVQSVRDHYSTLPSGSAAAATHIADLSVVYANAVSALTAPQANSSTARPDPDGRIDPAGGDQSEGQGRSGGAPTSSTAAAAGASRQAGGGGALRPVREAYARSCSAEYAAIAQGHHLHSDPVLRRQPEPHGRSQDTAAIGSPAEDNLSPQRSGLGPSTNGVDGVAVQPVGSLDSKVAKKLVRERNRYVYK